MATPRQCNIEPPTEGTAYFNAEEVYYERMDERSRKYVRELLLKRAAEDPGFRRDLLADPRAAVKAAFQWEPPADLNLQVHEDTPTDFHVVLPIPPPSRDSTVTLREVTRDNVRSVCALEVSEDQKQFVAPNSISIAEAHFSDKAWFRAIYADDTPVGFVMLSDDPEKPEYYLWRYMVAAEYQRLGFGRRALEQVIEYVRGRPNATELLLSYVPGEGSPRDFYASLGFEDTGEQHGGENVMKLRLQQQARPDSL